MQFLKNKLTYLRCVIVAAVFVFLLYAAGKILTPYYIQDTDQASTFYKVEKNTVDVLIAGSSTILVGLSPMELWENYGIVAHTRASLVQAPPVTWLNIKEAYKYQKPEVVVMGITSLFLDYDYDANEPYIRRGLDYKKLSFDKLRTVYEVVKRSDTQHILDYIFPVLRYHDRWKDYQWADTRILTPRYDFMHGQYTVYKQTEIEPRDEVDTTVPAEKENEDSWSFYKDAIEYCKSQGSEVIAVYMPDDRWTYGRYLRAKELLESCGAAYIDFNMEEVLDATDIDWAHDFYDPHHLTPLGAQKTTEYLGDFLVKNYPELPRYQCSENTEAQLNADLQQYHQRIDRYREMFPS